MVGSWDGAPQPGPNSEAENEWIAYMRDKNIPDIRSIDRLLKELVNSELRHD